MGVLCVVSASGLPVGGLILLLGLGRATEFGIGSGVGSRSAALDAGVSDVTVTEAAAILCGFRILAANAPFVRGVRFAPPARLRLLSSPIDWSVL